MDQPLTLTLFEDADPAGIDPLALFEEWFALAVESEVNDANAMALSTVDGDGMPDSRMVLLNGRDARGLAFFTNAQSGKGEQLLENPKAALLFHWKSLRRQVRFRGTVEPVTDAEADAYFASRPRNSQIASAVSRQSRPLASRAVLAAEVAERTTALGEAPVVRPLHWRGFRLVPHVIEFWKDGEFRLHDRFRFVRAGAEAPWSVMRLYP